MSGLGLKRRLRELILEPFWNFRGDETTNRPGVPITLETFLATRPDGGDVIKNSAGKPIGWADIYREMGKGPYDLFLNSLVAREDDFRYLAGPLIEEMVMRGYAQADQNLFSWWRQLCFETGVPAPSQALKKAHMSWVGEPRFTGEGEDLPIVTIRYGEESLHWKKKGCLIRFTHEFLAQTPIPVMEAHITEQTSILQFQECQHCVSTIVNGDISGGTHASPVIGVENTSDKFQYVDCLRLWTRGGIMGRRFFTLICGEVMGLSVEQIDEFSKRELGGPVVTVETVNRPVPSSMSRFLSEEIPDNTVQFVDTARAVRQRVFLPLHVEGARRPENLTQVVAMATSTTFECMDDKARIAVDETKAFSGYGFPDWFTLAGNRS